LPEYQPFPLRALPEPLREYVRQAALALGCDPAYVALPALAVVASLIGNARAIRLKRDWSEPSVLWTVVVGDSGTLKSPAYRTATWPLFQLQRQLLMQYRQAKEQYDAAKEDYDHRKADARKKKRDFSEEPPEKPKLPRVVCSDITVEKLAEILE